MGPQEEYIETVFTYEGDFYDPNLQAKLEQFHWGLKDLLLTDKQKLVLKKVEPWNSVRVTFNIPRDAALRLKQLAQQGSSILRELGVLAVQIEGDQIISLTIARQNNERTELVFRTSPQNTCGDQSAAAFESTPPVYKELGACNSSVSNIKVDVSCPGTPLVDSILNSSSSSTANNVFRSPNVVASSCEPIPFRHNNVVITSSSPRTTSQTTLAFPPGRSPTGYPTSPSQGLLSLGISRTPIGQPGLKFPSPPGMPLVPGAASHSNISPVNLPPPPPYPHTTASSTPRMSKPVTSASPLLVNLLQTDAASATFNNIAGNKMLPPPDTSPPKRKRRQRKPKESKTQGAPMVSNPGEEISIHSVPNPALLPFGVTPSTGVPPSPSSVGNQTLAWPFTTTTITTTTTTTTTAAAAAAGQQPLFQDHIARTKTVNRTQNQDMLNEKIPLENRKANVSLVPNIPSLPSSENLGQISDILSRESAVGKGSNSFSGQFDPLDLLVRHNPSRSEPLREAEVASTRKHLVGGKLGKAVKNKSKSLHTSSEFVFNKQPLESHPTSPCSNTLSNKLAFSVCDTHDHHMNAITPKSSNHPFYHNSKEQMSPPLGHYGQNRLKNGKNNRSIPNTAGAVLQSSHSTNATMAASSLEQDMAVSSPLHLSGSKIISNSNQAFFSIQNPVFSNRDISNLPVKQSLESVAAKDGVESRNKEQFQLNTPGSLWNPDKHNVPFYRNFDKSRSSLSAAALQSLKSVPQIRLAVEKQDKVNAENVLSPRELQHIRNCEMNQQLESPDSSKVTSPSDAESESSNQSSLAGTVHIVANPFLDVNASAKNSVILNHDSGLGSISEPSDDTPSESGDSETLKSTQNHPKQIIKDEEKIAKLMESVHKHMSENSVNKVATVNYAFSGTGMPHIYENKNLSLPLQLKSQNVVDMAELDSLSGNDCSLPKSHAALLNWSGKDSRRTATSAAPTCNTQYRAPRERVSPQSSSATTLHNYLSTTAVSCSPSIFDSRPFGAHLTTTQVTPEHLTTMASHQGSTAAYTTWCNPLIPTYAKMGLPGGDISVSRDQLKSLSSIGLPISHAKFASIPNVCSMSASSCPAPEPIISKLSHTRNLSIERLPQQVYYPNVMEPDMASLSNDSSKMGAPLDMTRLSENKIMSAKFSGCIKEKDNTSSTMGADANSVYMSCEASTLSNCKENSSTYRNLKPLPSQAVPSEAVDQNSKSLTTGDELIQKKLQLDCSSTLNGGLFVSQGGEIRETEISVFGASKDVSTSLGDKCMATEKITVQATISDFGHLPSMGFHAFHTSHSLNAADQTTVSGSGGTPVQSVNSSKLQTAMVNCQDLIKGSNITSIYTKRSGSTGINTVNCLPHLYAPDLPLPKRLTESVQRLVKPIPSSDHTLPRVRKSPVSSSSRQGSHTTTSPRSSPHHGKHTPVGSPRMPTVSEYVAASCHAPVSPINLTLTSSHMSWGQTTTMSSMHNTVTNMSSSLTATPQPSSLYASPVLSASSSSGINPQVSMSTSSLDCKETVDKTDPAGFIQSLANVPLGLYPSGSQEQLLLSPDPHQGFDSNLCSQFENDTNLQITVKGSIPQTTADSSPPSSIVSLDRNIFTANSRDPNIQSRDPGKVERVNTSMEFLNELQMDTVQPTYHPEASDLLHGAIGPECKLLDANRLNVSDALTTAEGDTNFDETSCMRMHNTQMFSEASPVDGSKNNESSVAGMNLIHNLPSKPALGESQIPLEKTDQMALRAVTAKIKHLHGSEEEHTEKDQSVIMAADTPKGEKSIENTEHNSVHVALMLPVILETSANDGSLDSLQLSLTATVCEASNQRGAMGGSGPENHGIGDSVENNIENMKDSVVMETKDKDINEQASKNTLRESEDHTHQNTLKGATHLTSSEDVLFHLDQESIETDSFDVKCRTLEIDRCNSDAAVIQNAAIDGALCEPLDIYKKPFVSSSGNERTDGRTECSTRRSEQDTVCRNEIAALDENCVGDPDKDQPSAKSEVNMDIKTRGRLEKPDCAGIDSNDAVENCTRPLSGRRGKAIVGMADKSGGSLISRDRSPVRARYKLYGSPTAEMKEEPNETFKRSTRMSTRPKEQQVQQPPEQAAPPKRRRSSRDHR